MGREKALMKYNDKTLIEYSLDVIADIEGEPLVVSNNREVQKFLKDIEVIPDLLVGRGPLGGIYTALEYTRDDILIVACDTPLLDQETIAMLTKEWGAADIAVYTHEGKIYPFPGIYSLSLIKDVEKRLEGAGKDLSLQDFIRSTANVKYIEKEEGVETLIGINTPEDYRKVTGHDFP
jgi:molybdopterin-guanine dinucleotide biosynthesis protein A